MILSYLLSNFDLHVTLWYKTLRPLRLKVKPSQSSCAVDHGVKSYWLINMTINMNVATHCSQLRAGDFFLIYYVSYCFSLFHNFFC